MMILKRECIFFYVCLASLLVFSVVDVPYVQADSFVAASDVASVDHALDALQWASMLTSLLGGLALFLYGIDKMTNALQQMAGQRLKRWLGSLTRNSVTGAMSGAAVTSVIQSSSVTTVLVVGFVSAGLMTTTQSIGVIMGANIGTTITAQIVAFKITKAALVLISVGFCCWFFGKQEQIKTIGRILLGVGMIFLGMNIMSEAMYPLRSYDPFLEFMKGISNPLLGIFIAAVFTAIIQSSSATTAIVIVMASQGFVSLEAGIAFALGANIGTCVTAGLASIGKPVEAKRAALIHVLFNVLGTLIWLPFIHYLSQLSVWISPVAEQLSGMERMAVEAPRQIANANTLFNVLNTVMFLPFAHLLGSLSVFLIQDEKRESKEITSAQYLHKHLLKSPTLALSNVRLEIAHMGQVVMKMLDRCKLVIQTQNFDKVSKIKKMDDEVDILQHELLEYMASVRKEELTDDQAHEFQRLLAVIDHIEHVGDVLSVGMVRVLKKFNKSGLWASSETVHDFLVLIEELENALAFSIRAISSEDQKAAQQVLVMSDEIDQAISKILDRQVIKLSIGTNRPLLFRLEMAFCEQARHIYSLSRRIAIHELPKDIAPDA